MDRWHKAEGRAYAQMIEDLDQGIGKILDKLEEKGVAENKHWFIFFSDNGPTKVGSAGPYSGNQRPCV